MATRLQSVEAAIQNRIATIRQALNEQEFSFNQVRFMEGEIKGLVKAQEYVTAWDRHGDWGVAAFGRLTRKSRSQVRPRVEGVDMARKKKGPSKPRNRAGLLPGQYRRRKTVFHERMRRGDEPSKYQDDMYTTDIYNIETWRTGEDFVYIIEIKGVPFTIPGAVAEQMFRHKESIIKEQRQERGREAQERRVAALVASALHPEDDDQATALGAR